MPFSMTSVSAVETAVITASSQREPSRTSRMVRRRLPEHQMGSLKAKVIPCLQAA